MLNRRYNVGSGRQLRAAVAVAMVGLLLGGMAQRFPLGLFKDFSLPEFYDAPHETQMKSLLQGKEALPQDDSKILIKKLRLETFGEDGAGEFILIADDCLYDSDQHRAASAGPLEMKTADGRFFTEGVGFLWQQNGSILTISNQVHTVIRLGQSGSPKS